MGDILSCGSIPRYIVVADSGSIPGRPDRKENMPEQKLYLPSNGSEGTVFEEKWCEKCIKMPIDPGAKKQCKYWGMAMLGEYNSKWIYQSDIPICTAFKSREEYNRNRKRYAKKDPNQKELFE